MVKRLKEPVLFIPLIVEYNCFNDRYKGDEFDLGDKNQKQPIVKGHNHDVDAVANIGTSFQRRQDTIAANMAQCENLIHTSPQKQQQYLIRFEMIHRTFVVPLPPTLHCHRKTLNESEQTDEPPPIYIINYIKRQILIQIRRIYPTSSNDPILPTLQRHLHSINDLMITQWNIPFGNVSLQRHLHHIYGGKGGFGTLLKGQSKQSSMTTTKNFTSCRNLQGQRLQQVNDQIHLRLVMEWKEKIQNGIATEYDMVQALTNTNSGIPGWHLPLPSWSEVSIKKEMKQNQKLLHRYQREQQQKEKMKSNMKQQQEEQLHYYIDTTNQWTEKMERTVTSALQQSIQKQRKQQQRQKLQSQQHQQEQEDDDADKTSNDQKRQKIQHDSIALIPTACNNDQSTNDEFDAASPQEQRFLLPPIVTISGNATIALLASMSSSSSSPLPSISNGNDIEDKSQMAYWNIQGDSNFCTIGVLLDYHTIRNHRDHTESPLCLYYEVVIGTGTGEIQIGWASTKTIETTNADDIHTTNETEDQSPLPKLFQPNSDSGEGVGDCQYSWGYDPTRNIKLHKSITESYGDRATKVDTNDVSSNHTQPGDVIGCTYNTSNGDVLYTYNGIELGIAYTVVAMELIPAVSLNEGEQLELRLHKHEMKYLPNDATAVGEIVLIQHSLPAQLVDNDNTASKSDKNEGDENDSKVDDVDKKPHAIETSNVNASIPNLLRSDGSPKHVIESKDNDSQFTITSDVPIDLREYNSAVELEILGLERLKVELTKIGLKCGGTLQERATRLFAIRDIANPNDYPPKLLAPIKKRK